MEDEQFSRARKILETSKSVEILTGPTEDYDNKELSGMEAARIWDTFPDTYDITISGISKVGEDEYSMAVKYRHEMDENWSRMVFKGELDRE